MGLVPLEITEEKEKSSVDKVYTVSFIFEPTCANARWAHMHHFASVQKLLDIKSLDVNSLDLIHGKMRNG